MKNAFDSCAVDYALNRPDYPEAVLDRLAEHLDSHCTRTNGPPWIVDVGAGTGIFSRQLAARGWRVVAVEPSENQLRQGREKGSRHGGSSTGLSQRRLFDRVPATADLRQGSETYAIVATAERTSLRSGSIDLVTAAQAFHWFNPPVALAEFARILRPQGAVALVWNNRDVERSPFLGRFEELIRRYNPHYEREYRRQEWPDKIDQTRLFHPVDYFRADWEWSVSIDRFVGYTRSVSYIRNILTSAQRQAFEDELRSLWDGEFSGQAGRIPMWTDLFIARRLLSD